MAVSPAYTTEAMMNRYLSAQGVIDYADHDDDNVADTGVVTDCIDQATEEINFHCREHYTAAQLATSSLVERWATTLAVRFLCHRRGNGAPLSVEDEFDRILAKLELIANGNRELAGIEKRDQMAPTWSNLHVDRRYRWSTIRRVNENSSSIPTKRTQDAQRTTQDEFL